MAELNFQGIQWGRENLKLSEAPDQVQLLPWLLELIDIIRW